jgi:hypothetical protein
MSTDENLPDWLRQLRDQQMGPSESSSEPAPPPPVEEPVEPEPAAPPRQADALDALREIAVSAEPATVEEPPRTLDIPLVSPIINQLTPFQRFVLALMLFLNVSVLGCLFLLVLGKISFVR